VIWGVPIGGYEGHRHLVLHLDVGWRLGPHGYGVGSLQGGIGAGQRSLAHEGMRRRLLRLVVQIRIVVEQLGNTSGRSHRCLAHAEPILGTGVEHGAVPASDG